MQIKYKYIHAYFLLSYIHTYIHTCHFSGQKRARELQLKHCERRRLQRVMHCTMRIILYTYIHTHTYIHTYIQRVMHCTLHLYNYIHTYIQSEQAGPKQGQQDHHVIQGRPDRVHSLQPGRQHRCPERSQETIQGIHTCTHT